MIIALAGGVGASKLLDGLSRVVPAEDLSIIVNTGDDIELFGLYIAPDLDIVTYTLAGLVNPATGWGLAGDTFHCIDQLIDYTGGERWFNLGDRDLATHIFRTAQMRAGYSLTEIAGMIRSGLGVQSIILPMTDTHTPTMIVTDEGEMHFQEYLVKRRAQPRVKGIRFEKIESARPSAGVAEAIGQAEAVVICPSNPLISIGPILAVPGMRAMIEKTSATVIAVSPVVGGASLKGPTDRMLSDLGMEVSATQVARMYADLLDIYIIDRCDADAKSEIEDLGLKVIVAQTVMNDLSDKIGLAQTLIKAVR